MFQTETRQKLTDKVMSDINDNGDVIRRRDQWDHYYRLLFDTKDDVDDTSDEEGVKGLDVVMVDDKDHDVIVVSDSSNCDGNDDVIRR